MKQLIKHLTILLMLAIMSVPLSSCGDDSEDEPDYEAYYDFSIVWEVLDNGDYTTSGANVVAAELTIASQDLFTSVTEQNAITLFNEFCQQLRYELSTGYNKITLIAKLVRNEGAKIIARKTFYIDPDGTTIKAPQRSPEQIVTIE